MSFIVDSSVIIAILTREDDVEPVAAFLLSDVPKFVSASTLMESGAVVGRKIGSEGLANLRTLLDKTQIETVPFDASQAEVGVQAYMRFGKGSGHKAKLNFGDCFSYALARISNLPLLFKGDDFIHTDIEPALKPA